MTEKELIEQLADKEHASWARWMAYVFDTCGVKPDGTVIIPEGLVNRWLGQVKTPYAELSEREKQSDRDEVAHILPIIREYALSQCGSSGEMAAMAWGMVNANNACISDLQRQVSLLHDEVFCACRNEPEDSNKTLLGHVNNLYRLIYSLQGEEDKKDVQSKLSDIIPIECEITPTEYIARLVWDKSKCVAIQRVDAPNFADEICIGLLWQNYAKEILRHIQEQQ
jgi:hypothetical protein